MRSNVCVAPLVCGLSTAFCLAASVFLAPSLVAADQPALPSPATAADTAPPRPAAASPGAWLADADRIAALEAVQLALSEVGDGSTYIWHARTGRISGAVQPTRSFGDRVGNICRHLIVELSSAGHSRKTEGIACRLPSGVWQLEG